MTYYFRNTLLFLGSLSVLYYSSLSAQCCAPLQGLHIAVEGLWWTMCQDNLDYTVECDIDDPEILLGPGETKFLEFDWCGGIYGCIGYRYCESWDIYGSYTWYKNCSNRVTDREDSQIFLKASLLHPDTLGENAEKATIQCEIKYQTFDLLLGRDIDYCLGAIVLHPFFGVKGIKIDQHLNALYEGGDFVLEPFENAIPARVRWHSNLCAIGLNGGLDLNYRWYCGFGLYGGFNGSVLAGRTDINHHQEALDEDGDVDIVEIALTEKQWVCVSGYQIYTGASWEFCCGDGIYYEIRMGYEFNYWFNTPQLRRYHGGNQGVSSDPSGNIGFHGAVLRGQLSF